MFSQRCSCKTILQTTFHVGLMTDNFLKSVDSTGFSIKNILSRLSIQLAGERFLSKKTEVEIPKWNATAPSS